MSTVAPRITFAINRGLHVIVAAVAVLNLVGLLVLMVLRMRYPFQLEWVEGATATTSQWILSGHFLYERLSLQFTPLLYNPLYFYISALVSALLGPGFLAPRLVSVLATIGACVVLFDLVRRETTHLVAALAAAGFYAATYKVTGVWMDVARVDSLLVLLLLLGAYWARRVPGPRGALGCAALLALAYFTKQSALPFLIAFGGYYLLESRRAWLVYWPAAVLFVLGTAWLLDVVSARWYSFYAWYIVRNTVLDAAAIRAFWQVDLLGNVPFALVASLVALALLGNPFSHTAGGLRSRFYWAFTAGALVSSWWNRSFAAAYVNALMPMMACLGLLLGLCLGLGLPKSAPKRYLFQWAALLLAAAQFVKLAYDPRTLLPTARDERAGREMLALIGSYRGDVFVAGGSYYTAMVGKPTFANWGAIVDSSGLWDTNLDVQRGKQPDPRRRIILDELEAAVASQRFDAIILDDTSGAGPWDVYWNQLLAPYYQFDRRVFSEPDVFWTVSGGPTRPQLVYVPRRP
jgi:dolichyl-phosphate-mannose-protein mannosyltransferase